MSSLSRSSKLIPQVNTSHPDPQLPGPLGGSIYWQTPSDSFLQGHRTTAELPEQVDVVIIGSGISGAQLARYLYEKDDGAWLKGKSVVMLEAREGCSGATGRNGGHCKPNLYSYPALSSIDVADSALVKQTIQRIEFELRNYELLTSYIVENSIPCDFKRVPSCNAYFEQKHFDAAIRAITKLQRYAPDIAKPLRIVTDHNELRDELRIPTAIGAVVFEAAQLSPYKFVCWVLKDLIEKHGLNLQTGTPVLGWTILNKDSHTPFYRVRTHRGEVTAPIVVHATNAYASHLLPRFRDLIYPVQGQMCALQPPTSLCKKPLRHSYGLIEDCEGKSKYLIQAPQYIEDGVVKGGELLLGGARGFARNHGVGVTDDNHVSQAVATELRCSIKRLFHGESGFAEDGATEAKFEWTGTMAFSTDGQPWVGQVPDSQGHFILAGFTGHGMSLTTASAKGLSDMIYHQFRDIPTYWQSRQRTITQAIYSYDKTVDAGYTSSYDNRLKHITFKEGDYIDVQEVATNGWWYGHVANDSKSEIRHGWFPSNYVKSFASTDLPPVILEKLHLSDTNTQSHCQISSGDINTSHLNLSWFPKSMVATEERMAVAAGIKDHYDIQQDVDIQHCQQTIRSRENDLDDKSEMSPDTTSMKIDIQQLLLKAQETLSKLQGAHAKSTELSSFADPVVPNTSQSTVESMRLLMEAVNEFVHKLSVIPGATDGSKMSSKPTDTDTMSQDGDENCENQDWIVI